jgi:hypothetical protein
MDEQHGFGTMTHIQKQGKEARCFMFEPQEATDDVSGCFHSLGHMAQVRAAHYLK